ncbi:hypothetical protein H6P81_013166 [Aristolochia fimbriata]|uniref:peptidylprolyl isomerase n=1 Tax=Aristolochia fimbriata TaxID=158543 RepID=A0AAV7EDX7_ARIFI|nr:hypothetical protein H6P81_013166 [Aristolochia fimbriata]
MATLPIAMSCSFHFKGRLVPEATVLANVTGKYHTNGSFVSIQSSYGTQQGLFRSLLYPHGEHFRRFFWPISAARSGSESSVSTSKLKDITLTDVKIDVESQDEDKILVRVDLTGEQTEKVFDDVLTNLARTAPPIPGFRRKKGGKTSNVPKSFLLQVIGRDRVTKFVIQEILSSTMANYVEKVIGRDRVTKFVIQEILSSTMANYVEKENLKVKKAFQTTQTTEELESAFVPGNEFGFNVTLEFETSETEIPSEGSEMEMQSGGSKTEPSDSPTEE